MGQAEDYGFGVPDELITGIPAEGRPDDPVTEQIPTADDTTQQVPTVDPE